MSETLVFGIKNGDIEVELKSNGSGQITIDFNDFIEKEIKDMDMINHPNHYAAGCSVECFDIMRMIWTEEELANYCYINAFKYIWRHENKNGLEDLKKAEWYVKKAKEIHPVSYKWSSAIDIRRQLTNEFAKYGVEVEI